MAYRRINCSHREVLKELLLFAGIAVGMNASVVLAQHEPMPNHENMSPGEHAKHQAQEDADKAPESKDRTEEDKPDPKKPKPDGHQHKKP